VQPESPDTLAAGQAPLSYQIADPRKRAAQHAGALLDALVLDDGGLGGERRDDAPFGVADGQDFAQDWHAVHDGALDLVTRPAIEEDLGDRPDLVRPEPPAGQRVLVHRRHRARLGVVEHFDLRAGPREQQDVRVEKIREEIQIGNDPLDQGGGNTVQTARDFARDSHRLRSERPAAYI
jgi:hypothetical protein